MYSKFKLGGAFGLCLPDGGHTIMPGDIYLGESPADVWRYTLHENLEVTFVVFLHGNPQHACSALRPSGGGTVGTPVFSAKIEMHLHEPGCNRPLLFHFFYFKWIADRYPR